jgi:hypothetical protein
MDAIKIKLNLEKIRQVNYVLANQRLEPTNDRLQNVERSILMQVGKRLAKKQINVFPSHKPFHCKLEYYEANSLEEALRSALWLLLSDSAEANILRTITDDINQKLA